MKEDIAAVILAGGVRKALIVAASLGNLLCLHADKIPTLIAHRATYLTATAVARLNRPS
jgi:hypothetical protein